MSSTFPDPDEERNAAEGPFPDPIPKRMRLQYHSTYPPDPGYLDQARRDLAEADPIELAQRYGQSKYGTRIHEQVEQYISDEATGADPWVTGSILIDSSDAGATGVYNKMVHRETDGPDPLVPEP